MADEATIETIKARARAVLDKRHTANTTTTTTTAGGGTTARRPRADAAADVRQGARRSPSPRPAPSAVTSPGSIDMSLSRDVNNTRGALVSSEERGGRSASPVSRIDIAPSAARRAPRGRSRSVSGTLNKQLAKVLNPSRTISERWKRFDAEAELLEQQELASLDASGADDDALDAELESLRARERGLLEKSAPDAEPVHAPVFEDETSQAGGDIDAELEELKARERALLAEADRGLVEPAPGRLPATDEDGKAATLDDREAKRDSSGCCSTLRARHRPQLPETKSPVPSASAKAAHGDDVVSDLQIPKGHEWRAPAEHGVLWRVCNFVLAILIGLLLVALLIIAVVVSIPGWILNMLVGTMMIGGTHFIVNTLYVSRLGKAREWLIRLFRRCCRSCRDQDEHSRPLRVDIPLPPQDASNGSVERFCTVHTIALFSDNYAYLIVDRSQGDTKPFACALIDPADASGVMKELERLAVAEYGAQRDAPLELTLQVEAILTTHKHWDHAWGNRRLTDGKTLVPPAMAAENATKGKPRIRVFGGKYDNVDRCTDSLDEGDNGCVVGSMHFEILHTPCHTAGSIMFLLRGVEGRDVLFTGDSLFIGGVGAPFEGSAKDSELNMRKVWLNCHPKTLIFAGHEYTLECLQEQFRSMQQIPRGKLHLRRLMSALHRAMTLRARRLPTVPASLGDEVGYNSAFDCLHSSSTLLQETWRRFKLVQMAREEAHDLGDKYLEHVVPRAERRSSLLAAPRWLRGGESTLVPQSSLIAAAGSISEAEHLDMEDEGWIAEHAQHLWSLAAQVEESAAAAAAVGLQLRQRSDQLRDSLSNSASLEDAEEALAAQNGDAQQKLQQGGRVRFVWGSSPADRQERDRIKAARDDKGDGNCSRWCCCCSCRKPLDANDEEELTLSEAAQAITDAANDCISLLSATPGAPGTTPGASALRRAASSEGRDSLRSAAVHQLDVACKALQAIDGAVEQDREDAQDILRAFVNVGGDQEDGTIAVGTLYRALTELGDERTVLMPEDVDELLQLYDVNIEGGLPRGLDDAQLDTSKHPGLRCFRPAR